MSYSSRKLAELIDAHRAEALGPFFRKLARATVAATALSLAACESPGTSAPLDAGPPGPSRAGAEDTYCVDVDGRTQIDLLAGVELDATPDSVSAIQQFWSSERFYFGRRGEICEGAPDVSLCRANFSSLGPARLLSYEDSNSLVVTNGNEAVRYTGEAALELLGPIQSSTEAALRGWLEGYDLGCGPDAGVREVEGGWEVFATRTIGSCPQTFEGYLLFVTDDGVVTVLDSWPAGGSDICVGRKPEGLRPRPAAEGATTAAHFADIARLEAAAVFAFERMADELEAHGAEPELVQAARDAAEDEVRHARDVGALASKLGADVPPAEVAPFAERDLFAMALENAVEGCVRETFGALVGHHQALAAESAEVRALMATIAEDETRHAALSWRVAQWLEPQLSETQREELAMARTRAIHQLRHELRLAPDDALVRDAGVPRPTQALALLESLQDTIWA